MRLLRVHVHGGFARRAVATPRYTALEGRLRDMCLAMGRQLVPGVGAEAAHRHVALELGAWRAGVAVFVAAQGAVLRRGKLAPFKPALQWSFARVCAQVRR